MGVLGAALTESRPEEALPVLEAYLAFIRRYAPCNDRYLAAQNNIATCLARLGRHNEALVLKRAIYTTEAASLGASHQDTIMYVSAPGALGRGDVAFAQPVAASGSANAGGRSQSRAQARPEPSHGSHAQLRAHPQRPAHAYTPFHGVDATVFHPNTGDDLFEAETIMQDVVQRRRRVFGPTHPETVFAETRCSEVREKIRASSS